MNSFLLQKIRKIKVIAFTISYVSGIAIRAKNNVFNPPNNPSVGILLISLMRGLDSGGLRNIPRYSAST